MPQRDEVVSAIVNAVTEIQTASGRSHDGLGAATALFGDIEGFDSLNGLEVVVRVGAALGAHVPESVLARCPDGASPTIGDVASRIVADTGVFHAQQ